ncbi:MAG: hypothetical protein FJ387_28375, partial [Verrucomicrobia bacterium]|nr:hypothetical protein [Verrucomicrobiota bacterium]
MGEDEASPWRESGLGRVTGRLVRAAQVGRTVLFEPIEWSACEAMLAALPEQAQAESGTECAGALYASSTSFNAENLLMVNTHWRVAASNPGSIQGAHWTVDRAGYLAQMNGGSLSRVNNLFWRGQWNLNAATSNDWEWRDNLLDQSAVWCYYGPIANSKNAYVSCPNQILPTSPDN